VLVTQSLSAQSSNEIIETIIEDIFLDGEVELEESSVADIYEHLVHYYENPQNINSVEREFFEITALLSDIQINAFFDYRNEFGPFISVEELQAIDGFTLDLISRIKPFLSTNEDKNLQLSIAEMLSQSESVLYLKWQRVLEDQRGYDENVSNRYLGDPNKYTLRYYNRYENRFRIGFLAEKDSGEEFFTGTNSSGFDYYSAHVYLKDYKHWLKDAVIGDYTISLAQGLVMHNDFGTGKSSFVHNVKKGGRTIRPYSSVAENNFLRGGAATFKIENFEVTPFLSIAKKDGSLNQLDTLDNAFFNGVLESGTHRTLSEVSKKDTITEKVFGVNTSFKKNNLTLGFYSVYFGYDATIQPSNQLYNQFRFRGDKVFYNGLDLNYRYRNFTFFGELSHAEDQLAYVFGGQISLSPKSALTIIYRDYDTGFPVLYSNPFGEANETRNEKGLYTSFSVNLNNEWSVSSYFDTWTFPWLRFQVNKPSTGYEYFLRVNYRKRRKYGFYIQYRMEKKEENFSIENESIRSIYDRTRQYLRFHLSYNISKSIELRNRVEFSFFDHHTQSDRGVLAYQDIIYRPIESPLQISLRYAIFDTDGFDSRIFAYENDLLYEFFIPAYSFRGTRFYINTRYNLHRNFMIEARYERTYFRDQNIISSGLELIEGNTRSKFKLQTKIKF
jgi:hypothetical protein